MPAIALAIAANAAAFPEEPESEALKLKSASGMSVEYAFTWRLHRAESQISAPAITSAREKNPERASANTAM